MEFISIFHMQVSSLWKSYSPFLTTFATLADLSYFAVHVQLLAYNFNQPTSV